MLILAVESSCDETAVALVRDGRELVTDQVFSQADLHAVYGGVVPEIASRSHVEVIYQLAERALQVAGLERKDIDAVAVTYAPGLIGALLVGVNFAKAAALALDVPLIPVHHIRGHIAANYLAFPELEPPFLCLAISGGNTLIADVRDYTDIPILGSTRDDAAGECFDKTARVLGLPYPGGVAMDALAQTGRAGTVAFPSAEVRGAPLDFSFSGLKTAAVNFLHNAQQKGQDFCRADFAASLMDSVAQALTGRLEEAARQVQATALVLAGGVSANSVLRRRALETAQKLDLPLYLPPLSLCGDNAAMIAAQGFFELSAGHIAPSSLNALATREIEDNEI